jgi:hypothetical protein
MIDKRINYRYGGDTMGGPNDKSKSGPGPDDRGSPEQNRNQRDIVANQGPDYEKIDYVGPTVFGPTQKYTGSFLDNLFNRGYRNINPVTGDFQSRFSQAGGFGKSIFGGILGLLNPLAGVAYKIGSSLPSIRNYDTLADYARGEFGLFQKPGVNIDKGRGSGLRSLGITEAVPPGINSNDYDGYRDREYIESAPVNNGILDVIDYTDPYQGGTYN